MEKLLLAAYTPPLRNKVREPAGSPTPFGVGLPGLILCRGQVRPQSECRLGKGPAGPFPLPLSPRELGEGACPPPCPLPGATPQSRCGVTAPLTQGSRSNPSVRYGVTAPFFAPKRPFGTFRCFAWLIRIKEHTVLFYSKRSRFSRGAACARGSRRTTFRCGAGAKGEPEKPSS